MAPNTKQLSAIVQQLSASDLHFAKAAFAPLTAQEAQPQQKVSSPGAELDNYWSWSEEATESENYWDSSANPKQDILSSSHIALNLVKSHDKEKTDVVHYSGIDSNDYWDERSNKDREPATANHVNKEAVESCWDWSPVDEQTMIARVMKDEQARQLLSAEHLTACLKQTASDFYWAEQEVEINCSNQPMAASDGDGYWAW